MSVVWRPRPGDATMAGLGYSGLPGTVLSADVVRLGWSKFNTIPVVFNTPGRRGRITDRVSESPTVQDLNSGVFDLKADVISLSLTATF